ncbi:hypothetical protein CHS0354_039802 [Potamilus streckersoni]|uniref:Uncharacterized protein n=1 Tax=Potamilus streckersoni TaxID=2493646 RepID=A0AAE0W0H8_9BIVA|nr:hypothetical protein CHS0354_039802 [Potamilus streckersoni]
MKQLRGIGDAYFDLLSDIVELVIILEAEQNQLRVVDDTLVVPSRQSVTIQKIQVNECLIKLSEKQLKEIRISASQVNDGLIRYKDKVPGIPRGLFLYVVQKHRPIFIAVFKAFLRIGLIMMLMLEVLRISSDTSNESSQITETAHSLLVLAWPQDRPLSTRIGLATRPPTLYSYWLGNKTAHSLLVLAWPQDRPLSTRIGLATRPPTLYSYWLGHKTAHSLLVLAWQQNRSLSTRIGLATRPPTLYSYWLGHKTAHSLAGWVTISKQLPILQLQSNKHDCVLGGIVEPKKD